MERVVGAVGGGGETSEITRHSAGCATHQATTGEHGLVGNSENGRPGRADRLGEQRVLVFGDVGETADPGVDVGPDPQIRAVNMPVAVPKIVQDRPPVVQSSRKADRAHGTEYQVGPAVRPFELMADPPDRHSRVGVGGRDPRGSRRSGASPCSPNRYRMPESRTRPTRP